MWFKLIVFFVFRLRLFPSGLPKLVPLLVTDILPWTLVSMSTSLTFVSGLIHLKPFFHGRWQVTSVNVQPHYEPKLQMTIFVNDETYWDCRGVMALWWVSELLNQIRILWQAIIFSVCSAGITGFCPPVVFPVLIMTIKTNLFQL